MNRKRFTERLQPSLLDRLTDHNPSRRSESEKERFFNVTDLKKSVIRDIEWLLNCSNGLDIDDLSEHALVRYSVAQYGIRGLSGSTVSNISTDSFRQELIKTITYFEPRILSETLEVEVTATADGMNKKALSLLVAGKVWGDPVPVQLYMRTDIDLETGSVNLVDTSDPFKNLSSSEKVS